MKKTFIMSLIFLAATSSMAASPEVLKAVLNSEYVSSMKNIEKVEVVASYRCPSCFDIVISERTPLGLAYTKVRTGQQIGGPVIVKYVEESK